MISAVKDRLTNLGLLGRMVVLALIVLAALGIARPIGAMRFGGGAWVAATAAALTVFVASALSMTIAELARRALDPALATVGATMLRMGLSLAACLAVHFSGGALSAGGYVYFVLIFYLLVLPLETAWDVARISQVAKAKAAA